jgi:hypothetical protein
MEAMYSYQTLVATYKNIRYHKQEDYNSKFG